VTSSGDWTVVVAARPPETAKSRLAVLGDAARRQLAEGFLSDVLDCLARVTAIGQVIVLTDVTRWLGFSAFDADVHLVPDQHRGLNTELTCAAAGLPRPVAFMPADLPCLRPAELEQAFDEARTVRAGVVPDRSTTGTTMLTFGTWEVFAHFGSASLQPASSLGSRRDRNLATRTTTRRRRSS
jgi:2-phospho-L-lactate guanylyltransferase